MNPHKCHYHPDNLLQNFCINMNCALPLCARCITHHLHQSPHQHDIQPLEDVQKMVSEQVQSSINGVTHYLNIIKGEFDPSNILKHYQQMIDEYRTDAIARISKHCQDIEKQVLIQLTNKYNQYLRPLIPFLQQNYTSFEKLSTTIKSDQNLESIIRTISEDRVSKVQQLLATVEMRKNMLTDEMPGLDYTSNGMLTVVKIGTRTIQNRVINTPAVRVMERRSSPRVVRERMIGTPMRNI